MPANRKVKDLEEYAQVRRAEAEAAIIDRDLGLEAASPPPPPKLPDVSVQVSVETILGVDAQLRNAIFQMGLGDTEGVRRCVQDAIKKLYPAFEECGKALTRLKSKPRYVTLGTRLIKDDISRDIKLSPDMSIPLPRGTSIPFSAPEGWRFDVHALEATPDSTPILVCVLYRDGVKVVGQARYQCREWTWANGTGISGEVIAWQPMPSAPSSIPEAPKGSPCRFPESWGQELGD